MIDFLDHPIAHVHSHMLSTMCASVNVVDVVLFEQMPANQYDIEYRL